MPHTGRRLIEDLLPIREISAEAVREKSLRHGNISTLHPWWARRPIVAARAAIYGALVPAPTNDEERKVSKDLMKNLCRWDFHQDALEQARLDILAANKGQPPYVLDMFTGGGSIPLEALRLGCETYAVDLNPVAHIIELCTLDYPQRYGSSLAVDVKRWGTWVIGRSKEHLTEFYPAANSGAFTRNEVQQTSFVEDVNLANIEDPLVPIAYLWTHTVRCPNPDCGATVPLVRQTWLCKKVGNYVALRLFPDPTTKFVRFEVVQASTVDELGFDPEAGCRFHNAICLHCSALVNIEYVKTQGKSGNMGQKLMAMVCTQQMGPEKIYLADEDIPNCIDKNELLTRIDALCDKYELSLPVEPVPQYLTGGIGYGLTHFKDLFNPRQLLSLLTFTAEVRQAYHAMLDEGMDPERAAAITTYLGVMINHLANRNSSICHWDNARETVRHTYARQALPMVWDFAEINPCYEGSGSVASVLTWITSMIQDLVHSGLHAHVKRASASQLPFADNTFDAIITDPPYYDNVPYAELSDFFYVWFKRSIGFLYPEHLSASLTPKKQEAFMATHRHDGNEKVAKQSYESMMAQAFVEAHRVLKPGAPLICIYTHKSTFDWSTLIDVLRNAGFVIVETWPLDTEMVGHAVAHDMEARTSSTFLVARRRESQTDGDFSSKVRPDMPIQEEVTDVDQFIASIGASLRSYTQSVRPKLEHLIQIEPDIYHIFSANNKTSGWRFEIAHDILRFQGVTTINQYLEKGELQQNDAASTGGTEVQKNSVLETVLELQLHANIRQHCGDMYRLGKYDNAVLNATKLLEVKVREKAHLESRVIGVDVIRQAFSPNNMRLRYSLMEAEQRGIMELLSGMIAVYKNPQSHRFVGMQNKTDCLAILLMCSTLLYIVDNTEYIGTP